MLPVNRSHVTSRAACQGLCSSGTNDGRVRGSYWELGAAVLVCNLTPAGYSVAVRER